MLFKRFGIRASTSPALLTRYTTGVEIKEEKHASVGRNILLVTDNPPAMVVTLPNAEIREASGIVLAMLLSTRGPVIV